jgi:cilia- and flagella-associated protein 69
MIEALLAILDVLKVPFIKELASDELSQVPNMPMAFNALCLLMKAEIPIGTEDLSMEEAECLQQFD